MSPLDASLLEPSNESKTLLEDSEDLQTCMPTAPDVSATKDEMIAKETQEMRDALQAFQTAIEAGEVAGFKNGAARSHGKT
jgi:flagellar biosynthesis/type III secretory pathway protein FliH